MQNKLFDRQHYFDEECTLLSKRECDLFVNEYEEEKADGKKPKSNSVDHDDQSEEEKEKKRKERQENWRRNTHKKWKDLCHKNFGRLRDKVQKDVVEFCPQADRVRFFYLLFTQ